MKCIKPVQMEDVVLGQYVNDPKATSNLLHLIRQDLLRCKHEMNILYLQVEKLAMAIAMIKMYLRIQ